MKKAYLLVGAGLLCIVSVLIAIGGPPDVNPKGTWQLDEGELKVIDFTPPGTGTIRVNNEGPGFAMAAIVEDSTIVYGPVMLYPDSSVALPMTPEQELVVSDELDPAHKGSSGTWEWL